MHKIMSYSNISNHYDLAIYDELFDVAEKTKKEFETQFKHCYNELNRIYKEMEAEKGFKSIACEGFMETFHILLMYQKDLIKTLPALYKAFSDFDKSLQDIQNHSIYKGLDA